MGSVEKFFGLFVENRSLKQIAPTPDNYHGNHVAVTVGGRMFMFGIFYRYSHITYIYFYFYTLRAE